jgi:hypothetical protein
MPNILQDLAPKILAMGLEELEANCITPRLVNTDYSSLGANRGTVIDIPVPPKITSVDVVPAVVDQTLPDFQMDTVSIRMNNWKQAGFALDDKQRNEIMDGVVPIGIKAAANRLARDIDLSVLGLYRNVYNYAGTAGTTPMSGGNLNDVIACRTALVKNNCPMDGQIRALLNPEAEAAALGLAAFQQYLQAGTDVTIKDGMIGRKLGLDWYMNQNLDSVRHTKGTVPLTGVVTSALPAATTTADASDPIRHNPRTVNTIGMTVTAAAQTVVAGDVFTVSGDSQTYVVNANATAVGTALNLSFSPAPAVQWAAGSAVTFRNSHATNMVFHRDAFALVVRPFIEDPINSEVTAGFCQTMIHPRTGLPLRLKITGEGNQVSYRLDVLWGVGTVRPELAVRLAG